MSTLLKYKQRKAANALRSDINVTPLVDVLLVLLVIFMITAPMISVDFDVKLPTVKAQKSTSKNNPKSIILSIDKRGRYKVDKKGVLRKNLVAFLKGQLKKNPKAVLYLQAHESLKYDKVVKALSLLSSSGFEKVSLMAQKQ